MTEPKISNLPGTGDSPFDAANVAFASVDLMAGTPLEGLFPPFIRHAVMSRQDRYIAVTFVETPFEPEDSKVGVFADADEAEVQYANTLELFRRAGWTVRDPEPWELPDPLASDAPLPF